MPLLLLVPVSPYTRSMPSIKMTAWMLSAFPDWDEETRAPVVHGLRKCGFDVAHDLEDLTEKDILKVVAHLPERREMLIREAVFAIQQAAGRSAGVERETTESRRAAAEAPPLPPAAPAPSPEDHAAGAEERSQPADVPESAMSVHERDMHEASKRVAAEEERLRRMERQEEAAQALTSPFASRLLNFSNHAVQLKAAEEIVEEAAHGVTASHDAFRVDCAGNGTVYALNKVMSETDDERVREYACSAIRNISFSTEGQHGVHEGWERTCSDRRPQGQWEREGEGVCVRCLREHSTHR